MRIILVFFLAINLATIATAQPVYESTGKSGTVFSDLPGQGMDQSPQGEKKIDLPPINVLNPLAVPPPILAEPEVAKSAAVPYTALKISEPENGGTIHSNTGRITVKSKIDPALQSELGHVIAVRLDSTVIPDTHKTTHFDITPADWRMAASSNVEHTLEIAVLDASGNVLFKSEPVSFFVHRASSR